jgi:anti-sigma B factor antagonist
MTVEAGPNRLTLEIERTDDGAIVRCHGVLVAGVTNVLYSNVRPLIPGSKRVVLDLSDLARMDSLGLGTLMGLYVTAKTSGCRLELIHIGKRIKELLDLTNTWSVFATIGEHQIKL